MTWLSKNKGTILGGFVIILAAIAYNMFFSQNTLPPIPSELEAAGIGEELQRMHSKLQAVTLDRSVFSSSAFTHLEDFSQEIPTQPTGRPNPFETIGTD